MNTNVLVMTFPNSAVTYEAFAKLKNSEAGTSLSAASLVERTPDGKLQGVEGADAKIGTGTLGGSLIGILIGSFAGPLGLLLGWGAGAATGALVDLDQGLEDSTVLARFASMIKPGQNAIVAEADEQDENVIDAFVAQFQGTVVRAPRDQVIDELEAEQDALAKAQEAARQEMRAKRKEERHEKVEERINALKAKFQH